MPIDFSQIKMPRLIFMPSYKGWLKGLGLHHATVTSLWILLWHLIGFGHIGALTGVGWYAQREYGRGPYPPKVFEVMDFMSPLITSTLYLIFS